MAEILNNLNKITSKEEAKKAAQALSDRLAEDEAKSKKILE
jgi:hypothetical protein